MPVISEHTRQIYSSFPDNFILWKSVQKPGKPKPDKVPCTPEGMPCNPLDASNHMVFSMALAVAEQTGLNLGFVLTDDHNITCVDIDGGRDSLDGNWHDWCNQFVSQFPNCYFEISPSGLGGHIWLKADKSRLADRRNKWGEGRFEYYQTGRFISVCTGYPANEGQIFDCTEQLLKILPVRELNTVDEMHHTGPDPSWTLGHLTTQKIIDKARNARGSDASLFANTPRFSDLFDGNDKILAGFYPSGSGQPFDHSAADLALASSLAFWCGKDSARMLEAFNMSALSKRDKWQKRADYQNATIQKAIAGCKAVYSHGQTEPGNILEKYYGMLTIDQQREYFNGCIYVAGLKSVLTQRGSILDSAQFRAMYAGRQFMYKGDGVSGQRWTDNPFVAFTENQLYQFPRVDHTTFRAELPFQEITTDSDGLTYVNSYKPRTPRAVAGDPAPFLDLVARLLPDDHDQQILLSYMAAVAQYPGRKFLWAPVIVGTQGNGKSTLINVLQFVVDGVIKGVNDDETKYTLTMTAKHIDDKFNAEMFNKILTVVHEMHSDGTAFKDEIARQDYLKTLITESSIMIEKKSVNKFNARNVTNFFFCSNHKDAVRLESSERRFAVFYTAQQSLDDLVQSGMNTGYFNRLWAWLRGDGFAICNHFLKTYEIPAALDPTKDAQRAPQTSTTDQVLIESRSFAEQTLIDILADTDLIGLRGGMVSSSVIADGFRLAGVEKPPHTQAMKRLLERVGYVRVDKASKNIGRTRPILYCEKNLKPYLQRKADAMGGWTELYMSLNGYGDMPSNNIIPLTKGIS